MIVVHLPTEPNSNPLGSFYSYTIYLINSRKPSIGLLQPRAPFLWFRGSHWRQNSRISSGAHIEGTICPLTLPPILGLLPSLIADLKALIESFPAVPLALQTPRWLLRYWSLQAPFGTKGHTICSHPPTLEPHSVLQPSYFTG